MKLIQKAKTTPKSFAKKRRNSAPECRAVCKKCPPMTC
jgi:hypothetical protein